MLHILVFDKLHYERFCYWNTTEIEFANSLQLATLVIKGIAFSLTSGNEADISLVRFCDERIFFAVCDHIRSTQIALYSTTVLPRRWW